MILLEFILVIKDVAKGLKAEVYHIVMAIML